jgi:putative transposase
MNPVRAKLVKAPHDWPYSSYCHYAFGKKDGLVKMDPLYASTGATERIRQRDYRKNIANTRS